ncbi:MAG TPA: hypothetical protein VK756_04710 [Solirubrobacteraceae bacterium]|nr:hypothetical protein [Solirubrobacteraceae bacterium]
MDAWTFIWLMVILKIPIVALFLLVRWAIRQTPEEASQEDGGIGFAAGPRPRHPHRPHSRLPHAPRRGPHRGASALRPPARIRSVVARGRIAQR